VATALIEAGKMVWVPCFVVARYDLGFEEHGRFYRVQCKTGRLFRGAVWFRPHSLRAAKRDTGWVRRILSYEGDVDYFGVYCPDNGRVYLVPIGEAAPYGCFLRVTPPLNNQAKRIRWAKDYEVVPLSIWDVLPGEGE
jgi:PD-(D/E)XK endonuclease